jgi:SAM-dependent methyltransferase
VGWRATGIRRWLPATTVIHDPPIRRTLGRVAPGARIADVGAGGRRITPGTFTIDAVAQDGVDLACDVHRIPLPDASFDCVFCTGTLQYVQDPPGVLAEIHRLLKPGGIVHVEAPFLQIYAPDPVEDLWRWTLPGLRLTCQRAGFTILESGVHMGPTSVLVSVAVRYLDGLLPGRLGPALAYLSRFGFRPLLALDRLWRHRPGAAVIASGVYVVGLRA